MSDTLDRWQDQDLGECSIREEDGCLWLQTEIEWVEYGEDVDALLRHVVELRRRVGADEERGAASRPDASWNPAVLGRAILDALRNAGGIDSFDVYELAGKAGLIERVAYDPETHGTISVEGGETFEDQGTRPGDEIWILTAAGREVTAATKEQGGPNA